jgi:hypothetical protein
MSFVSSALSILEEVGLDEATLNKAVAENIPAREAVINTARAVLAYWVSISPEDESGRGLHDVLGEPNEAGDYKRDLHIEYEKTEEGALMAKVGSRGPLIRLVEYGTKRTPEGAYAQKTASAFGAEVVGPKPKVLK